MPYRKRESQLQALLPSESPFLGLSLKGFTGVGLTGLTGLTGAGACNPKPVSLNGPEVALLRNARPGPSPFR
jgi:hypothetical protein